LWKNIAAEVGDFDSKIKKIFIALGFCSLMSFKGHFLRAVSDNDFIESVETSIKDLSDNSPLLNYLGLEIQQKNNFKLQAGEAGTILGLLEVMKEVCQRAVPFPNSQSSTNQMEISTTTSVSTSRRSKIAEITAANAESETLKAIRKRLIEHVEFHDDDFVVVRSSTAAFPFSLHIKCILCDKVQRVTISQEFRERHKFNIQTQKYTKHVKSHRI
jgi:hypothetical protein